MIKLKITCYNVNKKKFDTKLTRSKNEIKPDDIRIKVGLELNKMLTFDNMGQIATYFQVGMIIFNEKSEPIKVRNLKLYF